MKHIYITLFFIVSFFTAGFAQNEFITTWQTTTANESITIPTTGSGYNYTVDWGDGTIETGFIEDASHQYAATGMHTVTITGDFPRILFNNTGDKDKIISVDQWGDNPWNSMAFAFWGCANLQINATDSPDLTQATSTRSMFRDCTSLTTPDFSGWNVSTITDMEAMFSGALNFNGNVTTWDVGAVIDFTQTFAFTDVFNQDISAWNVGEHVSNSDFIAMNRMFRRARSFNRDLSNWDVSRAGTFGEMFRDSEAFDQSLGDWDISGLFSSGALNDMFRNTVISLENYDATLIGWATLDTDETQIPAGMTLGAYELSYCLAEDAKNTLESSPYFWTINDAGRNCDGNAFITTWETTSNNESITIPTTGSGYNYSVDWGDGSIENGFTGNATHQYAVAGTYTVKITGDFPRIYFSDTAVDKDKIKSIDQWGTIEWTNMQNAFFGCTNLTIADDAGAPDLSRVTVLNNMFADSGINTTGNLNSWNVSNVTSFYRMFIACPNFNQPLDNWNVSNATSLRGMFHHAINFNQDISGWDVGKCRNFAQMFLTSDDQTHLFNQDISSWNVGEFVTDTQNIEMYSMFKNAKNFDADLSGWDVSRVTNFNQMFYNTLSFDHNLGSWDISNATNMQQMFQGVTLSTENYDNILLGWSTLGTNETTIPTGLTFDGGYSTYCIGEAAGNILTDASGLNWTISDGGLGCAATDFFITTWETTGNNESITIPITGDGYDYSVDWGDSIIETGFTGNVSHSYATAGIHTVRIIGDFPRIYFNNSGDRNKIQTIEQWGAISWTSMERAFYGCDRLELNADDAPDLSAVTNLSQMFRNAFSLVDRKNNIENWDVSTITDMSGMFQLAPDFNEKLGTWDVGSVTNFSSMFEDASDFNQNLNNWNIGERVIGTIGMNKMFLLSTKFNSPLNNWDVSKVTNMESMFDSADSFNQPLNIWDVGEVTNMKSMFSLALRFNQTLGDWDISNVKDMSSMLDGTNLSVENYDATLIGWATDSSDIPENISFRANSGYCLSTNARTKLTSAPYRWDISDRGQICNFNRAFTTTWQTTGANENITIPTTGSGYDYIVDWGDGTSITSETGNATHEYVIAGTHTVKIIGDFPRIYFNNEGDKDKIRFIVQWGTQQWSSMENAFYGCSRLTLDATDTPDLSLVTNMSQMFRGASSLVDSQDNIGAWNVSTVTNMSNMFRSAIDFNENIGLWNVGNVTNFSFMFSTTVFNQNVSNWNIGEHVTGTINMSGMFDSTSAFNQPLNNWDVSKVTNMSGMFGVTPQFNQPLHNWDTSNVSNMGGMFFGANKFDQNLGNWNLSSSTNMSSMFQQSGLSTENYDLTLIGWATQDAGETIPSNINISFEGSQYCFGADARNTLTDPARFNWNISDDGAACDLTETFITTWEIATNNEEISFPIPDTGLDFTVDWGDGIITNETEEAYHTYANSGTYTIRILGSFNRMRFNGNADSDKIRTIEQWGSNTWTSMEDAFRGCTNLEVKATDSPDLSNVTSLESMFRSCHSLDKDFDVDFSGWDTSGIQDFTLAFADAIAFNSSSIANWNVSNANRFDFMFLSATAFDQDLGQWDISSATSMDTMLRDTALSTENYDATLIGWATLNSGETQIPSDITLDVDAIYCLGEAARNILTDANGLNWTISDEGLGCTATDFFVTTWETAVNNQSITVPTTGNGYDYSVDWGDGTIETGFTGNASHSYATAGIHTVRIIGDFPRIYFNNGGDKTKIRTIEQWGAISWTSMERAFYGCNSLELNADDTPDLSATTNLSRMFWGAVKFVDRKDNIGNWDVSTITDMSYMFRVAIDFNEEIGTWDVGSVTNFTSMFESAYNFNQNLNDWNIGERVTGTIVMSEMFASTRVFNSPLNNWDVSKVTNMLGMFNEADDFNQPLNLWDVSEVSNMRLMFLRASIFNQTLGDWDIGNVSSMSNMLDQSGLSTENYDATLIGWIENSNTPSGLILGASNLTYCLGIDARNMLTDPTGFNWNITDQGQDCDFTNAFVTTWQTTTDNESITIPTTGAGYNYIVDWGDGTAITSETGNTTHEYATSGTYTVRIIGDFPRIYFNDSGDHNKIQTIEQWGNIVWRNFQNAFSGCSQLQVMATDAPNLSNVTNLSNTFTSCTSLGTPDFSNWDTNTITTMNRMFFRANNFDGNITNWDVGNVTTFEFMFYEAFKFNQNISNWNIGEFVSTKIINLSNMFSTAISFNQPIGSWDLSKVSNIRSMFFRARAFNQPLHSWDVSGMSTLKRLFFSASSFNQPLDSWNVSTISNMDEMFWGASSFNQNLGNWDVSEVTLMNSMFLRTAMSTANYDATLIGWATLEAGETQIPADVTLDAGGFYCLGEAARNTLTSAPYKWIINDAGKGCPEDFFITTWQTTRAIDFITIPTDGSGYNYNVDWGDGTVETGYTGNATHTYATAGTYTVKIAGDFPRIRFNSNLVGNQNKIQTIEQWGTQQWDTFSSGFNGCVNLKLNADDMPDLSQATQLSSMFEGCTNFEDLKDQIGNWDMTTIERIDSMFTACSIFDEDISGWVFTNLLRTDSAFEEALAFNQNISNWNMATVTDMAYMFYDAVAFNQSIGNWTLGTVEYMTGMFSGAIAFNQDLSNWNFSQVQDIEELFSRASSFDQDLSSWDISSVTSMTGIFTDAGLSQANYDATLIGWASLETGETQIPTSLTLDADVPHCLSVDAVNTLTGVTYNWTINDIGNACPEDAFITTWQTTTANESITIPTTGSGYNYAVDWGDGTMETGFTGDATHLYVTAGTYTIKIIGDFPRVYFNNTGDKDKILSIEQWGSQQWTSMQSAFYGCSSLVHNAQDIPNLSMATTLQFMFSGTSSFVDNGGKMKDWNVSTIRNMSYAFGNSTFNENINTWNVSNVTNFSGMFLVNTSFNQPLDQWVFDQPSGISVTGMFSGSSSFNQDISMWNTSAFTKMDFMFTNASSFNQNLANWDLTKASRMDDMLGGTGISTENYDAILIGWATDSSNVANDNIDDIPFGMHLWAGSLQYCLGKEARDMLTSGPSAWIIDDGGQGCVDPIITLVGDNPQSIEKGDTYIEQGAEVTYGATLTINAASVNINQVGSYIVTYDATNTVSGVSATQVIRTVNVVDTTAPIITLNGANPQIIELGTGYTELGATNDDGSAVSMDTSEFMDAVGSYTIYYDATDVDGNAAVQVTRTVEVVDTTAPVITLNGPNPQIIELGDEYIELGATTDDGSPITLDTFIYTLVSDVGTYSAMYFTVDAYGNSSIVFRTVEVVDTTAPVITLNGVNPQTIELGTGYTELGATTDDGSAVSIDTSEFMDAIGSYTMYYDAADADGNAAVQVTRTVNVVDTTNPTVVCQNITVQLDDSGNVSITAAMVDNGSADISGIASLAIDITDFDCATIGDNVVVLIVTDANGNSDMCMATVTVEDRIAPEFDMATVPTDIEVTFDTGNMYTLADFTSGVVVMDNCDTNRTAFATTITQSPVAGTLLGVGDHVITLTATDENANEQTTTFTITVTDDILSVGENTEEVFTLYPNPAKQQFQVSGFSGEAELFIYDVNGRSLLIEKVDAGQSISIQELPNGVYFVKIAIGTTYETIRLMKNQ
ncbi:BspA family leucine-rich repeat surface protein [uncultured Aquimarina sp.]|uniref:BspA family leucine-rich repeat surface protein n=1 Tax=uncultured Aquimarina sp. TaxID=575652 RepID=UPI00260248D5|nr:BspA family leucine-rich repeat surface protein [uncultured Aquimarina sp.]